ncbi:hypothetical protein CFC21_017355 [Triticum aestivum]|uniref:Uncharacterized protein n=3 Tax=Triticum TaxID=4564 RepID=A0A9R1R8N5_TRITD|nr:uncharacterized protein LOC119359511 [Triticum dicoccoides]XP_044453290.1 uncharacterized protein LOC123185479 [Triticum aestivum]XP_048561025.1 uncharacterized protein LOC125541722 [Triticum urartu]KAF7001748.1 hypothetical protein CFC21_017355 [Triticum aestivum]VAH32300.1 unnamed protein product [Triticum turgidum subsp. durum]
MGRTSGRRTTLLPPQLRWYVLPLLLLILLAMASSSSCEASRGMQPFRGRPLERGAANHFFGFLPRGSVTPSGPSRKHNAVGLDSQLEKP